MGCPIFPNRTAPVLKKFTTVINILLFQQLFFCLVNNFPLTFIYEKQFLFGSLPVNKYLFVIMGWMFYI
jgi:hypothetical protein